MRQTRHAGRGERGAVFVQVGIAAFVLVSFNVFVLDYGMMWVARRQAQNAADAGALAGAVARGYDDSGTSTTYASQAADIVAGMNQVWNQAPTRVVSFDCPAGVTGKCVRVDVYRNGEAGSTPLPTLFGPMLGVTDQGVRATATALAGKGNVTTCLKPWAIPDGWDENWGVPTEFEHYFESGPSVGTPRAGGDEYTPPGGSNPGETTLSGDLTDRIIWHLDVDMLAGPPFMPIARELGGSTVTTPVLPLNLPGAKTYQQNMTECNGQPLALGQTLRIHTSLPANAQTTAMQAAYNLDSAAQLDINTFRIQNSCAPTCAPVSPRLFAIVLFDPKKFQYGRATNDWTNALAGSCPDTNPCITVTNIVGFFLHGAYSSYAPHGHLLKYPGLKASGPPTYVDDGSWLVTPYLIR